MSKMNTNEKIDLNSLTKKLCVQELKSFELYLKDVWVDLYSRISNNKNDSKEQMVKPKGLSKVIFNGYYSLPGIIGERLFNVFDTNLSGFIELNEFLEGMKTLFYENYEKNTKFIFDFYDFDNDGKINKEDIRVILSYITLTYSDTTTAKKTADKTNISFKNRLTSQEELNDILNVCFQDKHIKYEKIEYKDFRYIVENINSDIYLMIYLFLLENKPFSNKNIESYKNQTYGKESPNVKEKIMIASPTKGANFSPYKRFKRQSCSINLEKDKGLLKLMKMSPSKEVEKEMNIPRKKNTSKISKGIIRLQPLGEDEKIAPSGFKNKKNEKEKEKELDYKRVDELTHVKKKKNIRDSDSPLKPAVKQTKKVVANPKKKEKKKNENNIQIIDNEEEDEKKEENEEDDEDDDDDKDSSNDSSFEDAEDLIEDEGLNYQGKLYKFVHEKFKELWFKLVYKDLFYYKNKTDKVHRGMHNLSGLFLQAQGLKEIKGRKMYCFSILFPSKNRVYYCDNETEYNNWISALKKATGYTNLLDIYDIKQKLGKGKFGLVKLGINKETNDKVAVKVMNKNNMDSSDLELVRTEIEILKICQHPYIIKLYDIFENVDYIYIIMEYCKGGDLFSYLQKRNFTLKEEQVAIIMYKLCKAVYYVHSFGIAHRDIKPENVLLTSEDEDADIRLLDFGLSKIMGPNQKCTEPYGTLTYCAPEIILDKPYFKTVDSWSLGVMTYLMLCGSLPFSGKDEHEIAKNVVYSKVNFEKKPIWKEISDEAKDFITKLLDKDLKTRIEVKTALEHPWFKLYNLKNTIEEKKFYVKLK